MNISKITLNKNRGWRGLAELVCATAEGKVEHTMVFSFSQEVWDDMQRGYMVIQDQDNYTILHFNNTDRLPKGQRSVLLKYFQADVVGIQTISKTNWMAETKDDYYTRRYIENFRRNRNNHTTSDWNCIGIRVMPNII